MLPFYFVVDGSPVSRKTRVLTILPQAKEYLANPEAFAAAAPAAAAADSSAAAAAPAEEAKAEEAEIQQKTERQSMPPPDAMASPQIRRGPHSNSQGPGPMVYANSPRHPSQIPPGMPFNNMAPVPAAQFYGNGDMGGPSPMRMGNMSVHIDPMNAMGGGIPGMGGMPMGNMAMAGLGGMTLGSPNIQRGAMRRGMSMGMGDDGFGGMH